MRSRSSMTSGQGRLHGWRTPATFALALGLLGIGVGPPGCSGEGGRDEGSASSAEETASDTATSEPTAITVTGGFQTPESVIWDPVADVYLVSNVNGDPFGQDDNGFISRVGPDGTIETLKWIDGETPEVTLNAPKGMVIYGDTLFVADIDHVRAFHRVTGAPLFAWGVEGAMFLNDLALAPDGTLYASDSGVKAGFQPAGADALYRFEDGKAVAVVKSADLSAPNGIVADADSLTMVPFGGAVMIRLPRDGSAAPRAVVTLPAGQLDGLVLLSDGSFLVSSWEGKAVYRVPADGGPIQVVLAEIPSPADIGWDGKRGRVLVPVFTEDRVEVRGVE